MPASASVSVTTLFSPWDDTQAAFLDFIRGTQDSLFVVIYGLHLPPLTDSLIVLHRAGKTIGLILDHSQEQGKAEQQEVQKLVDAGIGVLVGTSPVHGQILHSKFSVRDGVDVETGSWNYSLSASQQSNTMTYTSDPTYAQAFLQHYHRLHAWCMLHDMAMQPAGAQMAPDVPEQIQATAPVRTMRRARRTRAAAA